MSDSVTPWTVARQAPLSLGFSRQEYWSGLPCPPPDLHDPVIEPPPVSSVSCIWQGSSLPLVPPGKPHAIPLNWYKHVLLLWITHTHTYIYLVIHKWDCIISYHPVFINGHFSSLFTPSPTTSAPHAPQMSC